MKLKYPAPAEFLKEEIRNGYVVTAEMKQVWAVQLDLMQELLRVCKKNGLKVYADGGTLLGAIRHQGYIPWDDDIDMMMLREDYDKLMLLSSEFEHPYFLQNVYTDCHYGHRITQLRNSDTACWSSKEKGCNKGYNQGICIDIFPCDNIPLSPRAINRYYKKEGTARQKFRWTCKFLDLLPESLYQFCRNHVSCLSDKKRYEKYENVLRSVPVNPMGYICEISFKHNYPLTPIQYFGEPQMAPFEFTEIPILQDSHKFLETFYGADYMTPRQAPTEHGAMKYNTEVSYLELKKK